MTDDERLWSRIQRTGPLSCCGHVLELKQHCCQLVVFSRAPYRCGRPQIDLAKNVRKLGEMHTYRCTRCGSLNRVPETRIADGPICGRCKHPLDASGAPQEVTERDLEQALKASPVPVLVDFWAPWCGPCRMAAPVVDRAARSRAGRILVLKLNSDDHPAAAERHRIQGIPAFIMFQGGVEVSRQVGLLPEPTLARWIDGFATAA